MRKCFLVLSVVLLGAASCVTDSVVLSKPVGSLAVIPADVTVVYGELDCLTRFNACVNMAGYQELSGAFYNYISGLSSVLPSASSATTISVASTATGTPTEITSANDITVAALNLYFPTVTPSGVTAVNPGTFVTTGTFDALLTTEAIPDVLLVGSALAAGQWGNLVTAAASGSFILATDVTNLPDTTGTNFYVVQVLKGATETVAACTAATNAEGCITVNNTIGGTLSTGGTATEAASTTNNLYVLGSGFAMLKTLFAGLTYTNMFAIIQNDACETSGYFTFACVVEGTNISVAVGSVTTPETKVIGSLTLPSWNTSCLTRFNACDLLSGYQELSGAFYNYISGLGSTLPEGSSATTISVASLTAGTIVADLDDYFPMVTPSGESAVEINPANFVTTGVFSPGSVTDEETLTGTMPDVLLVASPLSGIQWANLETLSTNAFILAADVTDLPDTNATEFYVVQVAEGSTACPATLVAADECISVSNTIGGTLNADATVSADPVSATNNLYVLGSAFAMLKTLFPADLNHEGMFAIAMNTDCRESNGLFSFSCLVVNDGTSIVPNPESAPEDAPAEENSSLSSSDLQRAARSAAQDRMYSAVMSYSAPKTLWQDGSVSVLSEQVHGSVVGSRMRAQYHTQGASVGALISAYRYDDRLSALSRSSVDARMALGVTGDLSLASAMRFYGQIFGVYETGLLSSALFGEHRVDRVMGVGVVGVSYQMSSGSAVALEGRCSVGHLVSVAGAVAAASSFCDTALRIKVIF